MRGGTPTSAKSCAATSFNTSCAWAAWAALRAKVSRKAGKASARAGKTRARMRLRVKFSSALLGSSTQLWPWLCSHSAKLGPAQPSRGGASSGPAAATARACWPDRAGLRHVTRRSARFQFGRRRAGPGPHLAPRATRFAPLQPARHNGLGGRRLRGFGRGVARLTRAHRQWHPEREAQRTAMRFKTIGGGLQAVVNVNRPHLPGPAPCAGQKQRGRVGTATEGHRKRKARAEISQGLFKGLRHV
jgi:hypothetical protein